MFMVAVTDMSAYSGYAGLVVVTIHYYHARSFDMHHSLVNWPGTRSDCGALQVITAGGGAANEVWTKIRAQRLGVPVRASQHTEAAYGAALLALQGLRSLS